MRPFLILTAAALALGSAAAAAAQPPAIAPGAAVTVAIGPDLQKKAKDYGERELTDLSADLRRQVQQAAARTKGPPPLRIDLVIEDAVPNRPTFEQLGRTIGLSMRSVGVGGARVSGTVTYADGVERPIREQYYETDLRQERGVTPWHDADLAFDRVTRDIGRGALPAAYVGPGPTGGGHFGYPFNDR